MMSLLASLVVAQNPNGQTFLYPNPTVNGPCVSGYRTYCSVSDPNGWGITYHSDCSIPTPPTWSYPNHPAAVVINIGQSVPGVVSPGLLHYPTYAPWPGTGNWFYTQGNGVYYVRFNPPVFLIGVEIHLQLYTPFGSSQAASFTVAP